MNDNLCEWGMITPCFESVRYDNGLRILVFFETECGELAYIEFEDDKFKYCPYCGKEIKCED